MSLPHLSPRKPDAHKGDFGRALVIGGSPGMAGAVALSGMATLRGGAGLTTLAVADLIVDVVASFEPSYMTAPLASDGEGKISIRAKRRIAELRENATCVAIGPGLGRSRGLTLLVEWLYETTAVPMVIDADALNALASIGGDLPAAAAPRILTPHPGEFRRLVGNAKLPSDEFEAAANEYAAQQKVVLLLKGQHTLITDGKRSARNTTGNPGMATGGSGDVLTGLITALVCQGLAPFEAAQLGAHVHGLAGDLAAQELGEVGMIASDLVRFLPAAIK